MNRPILVIVIGYIIGIIWGLYLQVSIVFLYVLLGIIYIIINIQYTRKEFKILSITRYLRYPKMVFKTSIIFLIIISSFIANIIIKYPNEKKYEQKVELIGIVVSNKIKDKYKVKVDKDYLYVKTKQELEYGDKIFIIGEYQEPDEPRNYKGFNYKQYLKTLKISGTIKAEKVKILERKAINSIANEIYLKIKENILKTYNEESQGIILGILLGDTENISKDKKNQFSQSNISHILAVSGMHVSYIIYLVTNSTHKILGKRKSKIVASIVLIIYMLITNFSISVVRACIMGIISCMSFVLYRRNDTINNISISALIILINNPFCLLSMQFQLTFGGTIGIIIFKPLIEKLIKSLKVKKGKWKYIFIKVQRKSEFIIEILSVSISAQLIITPIIAINYNSIGISFLITNLLLNIVIGTIVMGGMIQVLISFISIKVGIEIAKVLQKFVQILVFISKIGVMIPFGNFKIVTPDLYQIIIYYIIIILFNYLYPIFNKRDITVSQKRLKNIIYLIKYKIHPYSKKIRNIALLIIFIISFVKVLPNSLKIHFVDVKQGDSTLIVTPQNKIILIDRGGSETYDVGKNTLLPYLLDRKIMKIDYILISHMDFDHVRAEY